LDSELQYWAQAVEKQKALARLESLTGLGEGMAQAQTPAKDAAGADKAVHRETAKKP